VHVRQSQRIEGLREVGDDVTLAPIILRDVTRTIPDNVVVVVVSFTVMDLRGLIQIINKIKWWLWDNLVQTISFDFAGLSVELFVRAHLSILSTSADRE